MIEVRQGSLISKLLFVLSIAGEFPMCSISLFGNYQSHMRLINKATKEYEYFNPKTKEHYKAKLLTIVGKGREKSLRMLSGAYPVLEWLGLLKVYLTSYGDYRFTGKLIERERIHRVAEGYAMMYLAGLAVNPLQIPKLQQETLQNLFLEKECYYGSKQLKEVGSLEMNKNAYTRIVGAVFANKNVYAVYNTRHQIMKWNGRGEKKTLINLEEISRMNANVYRVTSAILLGKNTKVILETLRETEETKRLEFCFDGIYTHIHFVPMDANGVRQLRLLCLEDWREELLSALFPDEMRSYDQGGFEYDASIGGKFILTFFDGDIARLQRFRYAAQRTSGEYEVLCFPFQVELIKGYLGDLVKIKTVKWEVIENALGIGGEN